MGQIIIPPSHREDARGTLENTVIECETNSVSDGYHTFGELYNHRCLLFIALVNGRDRKTLTAYKSWKHDDGTQAYDGWFIAGLELPTGQITYHLLADFWQLLDAPHWDIPPKWDGHTSQDVEQRLKDWLLSGQVQPVS